MRSRKLVRLHAGKADCAAATASPAWAASSRLACANASPVAGLTAGRRPARPSTSRPPTQEWKVGRPVASVAIGRFYAPREAPLDRRAPSYSRMRITTRRFCARSSRVLLSVTGFSSP